MFGPNSETLGNPAAGSSGGSLMIRVFNFPNFFLKYADHLCNRFQSVKVFSRKSKLLYQL